MNALVCTTPGQFQYQNKDIPKRQAGHTLLKIKRIGICGTDLHAFEGTQPFFNYPRILGHELTGEIAETEADNGFHTGESVTISPYFYCGKCVACRNGKPNCCVQINVLGVHIDGGMQEYVSVPDYALIKGAGLSLDELALVEPLAIGAHGIRRAAVQEGEFVLVIGAGPIGLGAMEMARIAGAQVIAMDINDGRLQFCRDKMGVAHTINPTATNATTTLAHITAGEMPTVVIDCTGNGKAINNAFQYMAHGARFVLIGLQRGDITFSHPEFHKREATLMSSRNATLQDFQHVIASMKQGHVNPTNYITHRVSFEEVPNTFADWLNPETGVIKAMVSF